MSEFSCPAVRVKIEPHPNADAIEIAKVGDFQSVVRKGQFNNEDLAVYIPEQALVPEWLLRKMGLWDDAKNKGGLSGSLGNRVKAIKLRGIVSQGLVLDWATLKEKVYEDPANSDETWVYCEDQDFSGVLGVTKYEPPIPTHMAGRIVGADLEATHGYDFENLKKHPSLFEDGEEVVITEKIHGTLLQVCVVPSDKANDKYFAGRVAISSKGLGAKGFVLDHNDETNLYAQAAKKHGLLEGVLKTLGRIADNTGKPCFLFGEVFGVTETSGGLKGVQDLTYTGQVLDFAAFDACVGNRGAQTFFPWRGFVSLVSDIGCNHVPVLYLGPYSKEVVAKYTDGPTTLIPGRGKVAHIREGVVVKSAYEDSNPRFGRKIAKSISDAYLLRKGEATEFQ